MTAKQNALQEIAAIASQHDLTPAEVLAALPSSGTDSGDKQSSILTRLLGYLGGIFVFAGLAIFITMQWDGMNALARVVVTLGSGMAAFVMAVTGARDERFAKAATPLFLLAALLQPTGILVALDEFSTGGNERYAVLLATGVMLVQQGAIFWTTRRTALLFLTLCFAICFCGTAMDLIGLDGDLIVFTLGASVLLLSRSIDQSLHEAMAPFWYFVSSAAMLGALFSLLEETPLEILFLGAACGLVFVSTWVKSRTLLLAGTVAILSYIGYFTSENFAAAVGWPIALMLFGLLLIGLSALAFRINRKYIA